MYNNTMKQVTFGENTIYPVANFSDYIRLRTFPKILKTTKKEIMGLLEQLEMSEKLSIDERKILIGKRIFPWIHTLVHNRDVKSLKIRIKGKKGDLIDENIYNRTIILTDFIEILGMAFQTHKKVKVIYGQKKTQLIFNVEPFKKIKVDVSKMV